MNKIFIASIMMAALPIACSAPSSESAETAVADDMKIPVFTGPSGSENIAVSGYDTVSYFEGGGVPVEGSKEHRVKYNGVEYRFASAENAAKFAAEPTKFAPQYGGHCAWAASRGKLASGDPTLYKIVDGKLYLNFNQKVQDTWNADIPGFIEKADKEFPKIPADARYDDA